eukprot:3529564-Pyramimonas_sp.AAC.2
MDRADAPRRADVVAISLEFSTARASVVDDASVAPAATQPQRYTHQACGSHGACALMTDER